MTPSVLLPGTRPSKENGGPGIIQHNPSHCECEHCTSVKHLRPLTHLRQPRRRFLFLFFLPVTWASGLSRFQVRTRQIVTWPLKPGRQNKKKLPSGRCLESLCFMYKCRDLGRFFYSIFKQSGFKFPRWIWSYQGKFSRYRGNHPPAASRGGWGASAHAS